MDNNRSGDLSYQEFRNGLEQLGYQASEEEYKNVFQLFDQDGSGNIKYDEFLNAIRPSMNKMRISLVEKAFAKMDKTGDGVITIKDLQGVYNIKSHPEYLNGNKTEQELFGDFIKKFEKNGSIDGQLTKEEFMDYYSGVSASIDDDMYFDLMMRQAWKL
ncbi:calcyphosin-like protein [Euroglyphus maynei]|uniref:Calcyphosin-like protein n=1 Tax=Euroglyphus maynei TaxID=6958 RepID=A0A1Y3BJ38_EURMA|nr:calcyphosin-like protein [Euroglyphus maynei]